MKMKHYPLITHALRTCFNAEDGLSIEVSIGLYTRNAVSTEKIDDYLEELDSAMSEPTLSWKKMLLNNDYEVYDAGTENEAKQYAMRILVEPLRRLKSDNSSQLC